MLSLERQNMLREQYRQAHPGWRPATEVYADLVRNSLRPDSRILDLGCGRGGLVEQLDHPLSQIVGVDHDLLSLGQHRLATQSPPLPRSAAVSSLLPFADDSFDLVLASWVLEHLARPEADFGQIGRVLRPGGSLIFITPNKRHPLASANRLLGRAARTQDRLVSRLYGRAPADSFPAYYRANSASTIRLLGRSNHMRLALLQSIADPTYMAFTPALFRISRWVESRLPAERHIHLVGVLRNGGRAQVGAIQSSLFSP